MRSEITRKRMSESQKSSEKRKKTMASKEYGEKISKANTDLLTEKGKTGNLTAQVEEKTQALATATKAFNEAKAEVSAKKEAIQKEIGDKDPDTFENQLLKEKDDAEENVVKQQAKINNLGKDKEGLEGQVEATEKTKKAEETKLAENEPKLNAWLFEYNAKPESQQKLSIDDIARISHWTDDWEAIRQKQKDLTTEVTKAQATYDNENSSHNKHQEKKPADDKETLEARRTELEQKSNEELIGLKAQKQRHDDAKAKIGPLLVEVQEKALQKKEWEEIADAIGSEGKTLRKIAQCYTLRFLIAHANVEIRKFNRRYELQQVKNSLGIRVIDHDRADDIRDTTSLSGGETFIVSLGLALGLSALSSKNISFENLFIDEGFGTLDQDTLETVINSLAMLQSSQGKKVGVISHTESMSHITTQIQVIRDGSSGSSHIEIYPS